METDSNLMRHAAAIAEGASYVASELPEIPELTGDPVADSMKQLGLVSEDLAIIVVQSGDSAEQRDEACVQLAHIAELLGAGLSPSAKGNWVKTLLKKGFSLEEILDEAQKFQDSSAT